MTRRGIRLKYQYALDNPLRYVDPDGHQSADMPSRFRQDLKRLGLSDEEADKWTKAYSNGMSLAGTAGIGFLAAGLIATAPEVVTGLFLWSARNPDKVEQIAAALQEAAGGPPGAITGASMMSKAELSFAQKLAAEGKNVEKLAESTVRGVKSGDFLVNGIKAELKTIESGATAATLKNAIARGVGQGGGNVFVDASATGLSLANAERAAARVFGADRRLQVVRIVGKGFDVTIARKAK